MIDWLLPLFEEFFSEYGLPAILISMLLESAMVPIPSEIVVPLGGFLAQRGFFSFWTLVIGTSLANLVGAWIAYHIGARLFWIHEISFLEEHLRISQKFFDHHGRAAVFFGRMLPAVRTFMSLPAGIAEYPEGEFILLTFIGSVPWNLALAAFGYLLGENWVMVHEYGQYLTLAIIALLPIVYFAYRRYERFIEEV